MERKNFLKMLALAATTIDLKELSKTFDDVAKTKKLPVLFTSHGNPMDILNDTALFRALRNQGEDIQKNYTLNAVLIISAHWNTNGTFVNISKQPETIYDFYGFPETFYKIKYNAPGSPELASEITKLSNDIHSTTEWGFDHGSWPILRHLFPNENVPIVQMSMDYYKSAEYHFNLATQLKSLREKGILIIGSGSVVHNLKLAGERFFKGNLTPYGWDIEFDNWVMQQLNERNYNTLINYKNAKYGNLAAPTPDHYIPLLYSLGVTNKDEPVTSIYQGVLPGFSDRSFRVG